MASMLTLEVARRTWWLWIIPVSAVVALIVMNPQGFMALLVATGTFIWGSILNVFNWLFAAISWTAQGFISLVGNFFITIVNMVIMAINKIPGINIPLWPYLKAPTSESLSQISQQFAAQWQVVKTAGDAYIAGVQERAPGVYLIGATAGTVTGGGLYLVSGEKTQRQTRRRTEERKERPRTEKSKTEKSKTEKKRKPGEPYLRPAERGETYRL